MEPIYRPTMLTLPNESEKPNISDSEMRKGIWGPWYWFVSAFGLVFPAPKKESSLFATLLLFVPNLIVLAVLAVRAGNIMYIMSITRAVSFSWAYMTILFSLSIHALTCAATLTWYKHGNFFNKMTAHIRELAVDNFETVPKLDLILQVLVIAVGCFPSYILYIVDSFSLGRHYSVNGDNDYVTGIYRDILGLYIADVVVVILSAYVTSAVFIVYLLSNSAVCRHYDSFLKKLTTAVKDGTISKVDNLKHFDKQLIHLLSSICYLNTVNQWMLSISFVTSIVMQICAQLSLTSFSSTMHGVEYGLFALWFLQSVVFMIFSLKKPGIFYEKLVETKHLLWLDQGVWSKSTDVRVLDIAEGMIHRIETVDYPAKGMAQVGSRIFGLILMIIPLLVAILAGTARFQAYNLTNSTSTSI
uniref:Gustatory receptor n=1 Tax=Panagrellus redivivus TaxID=6233 RepID=A0A7E4VC46_PANRE